MTASEHSGKCLCGAVTFTVQPANSEIGVCHCDSCRRWTSGPFMGIDCGSSFRSANAENLGVYNSSEWAERGFCKQCGTTLFYRLKEGGTSYVSVGVIDGLADITLAEEVFVDEKPDYYDFAQKTNKMTGPELFALFASKDH
ncbi:MAG: GFA family protein [Aestuariivirgaceae bacterium]